MVERLLSMHEVPGSIPWSSRYGSGTYKGQSLRRRSPGRVSLFAALSGEGHFFSPLLNIRYILTVLHPPVVIRDQSRPELRRDVVGSADGAHHHELVEQMRTPGAESLLHRISVNVALRVQAIHPGRSVAVSNRLVRLNGAPDLGEVARGQLDVAGGKVFDEVLLALGLSQIVTSKLSGL